MDSCIFLSLNSASKVAPLVTKTATSGLKSIGDTTSNVMKVVKSAAEGMESTIEKVGKSAQNAGENIKEIGNTSSNTATVAKSVFTGVTSTIEGIWNSAQTAAGGIGLIRNAAIFAGSAAAWMRQKFETAFIAIKKASNWLFGALVAGFYSTIRLGDEFSRLETQFGIPADVAYVWKNTLEELDINFENFLSGARSIGRGFMQLERMMPKPEKSRKKEIITPEGLANLKLMAEHYKRISQYNYYYSQTAKQLSEEVDKQLKKLEKSL